MGSKDQLQPITLLDHQSTVGLNPCGSHYKDFDISFFPRMFSVIVYG